MTTFTMQDLNQLPNTPEEDEAMDALAKLGGGVSLGEMFTDMGKALANHELAHQQAQQARLNNAPPQPAITKEQWMEYGMNNPISASAIDYATQHASEPQPTPTGTDVPSIDTIINTICTQLQLLATVIKEKQGNSLNVEDQSKSLQECVSLTLQQADWFKDLIRHELIGGGIEDLAKDAVQDVVENEVESYFENNFDPSYHFDFDDAVSDAVDDRIDNIVSDKIDDAVESYLAEATITISK